MPPVEHPSPARAAIAARFADDQFETLALEIVLPISAAFDWSERVGCRVSLEGEGAQPYAFAAIPEDVSAVEGRGLGAATIWARRRKEQQDKPVSGFVFTPQLGNEPGHKVPFFAPVDARIKSDPKVLARWAAAFATHVREIGTGAWNEFAAQRVAEIFGPAVKRGIAARPRSPFELGRAMETTTGLLSVQEALQHDRPLLLAASKEKRSVPVAKLSPPRSKRHPWDELLRGMPNPPAEPLAAAVPAEFWYARAADLASLFAVADELDAWGTPAANLMDRRLEERDLAERYETQLGLPRTALGRALGPEVIESVAFAGSDPYLREGSDVTAIFKVRRAPLFDAALESMVALAAKPHGSMTKRTVNHGALGIAIAATQDGAVRQHRATVGDLTIVSNSLAAMERVLDTLDGKHTRLADELDFRYMLARDASERSPLLVFLGDRFIAEVIGPRQKILEARRQLAAAELMTPGFAALLHGWLRGASPASVDALVATKLLRKEELKHASGGAIEWRPGTAAHSTWGTPAALTPLLELPSPDAVTESERAAYDGFSRTYETYWYRYLDPAALRIGVRAEKPAALTLDLRVLPLIDGTDYREILELAGQARVTVPPVVDGLRAALGIGADARLRHEAASLTRGALGRHAVKLDFLGDWAMVGIADRTRLAGIAERLRLPLPEAPEPEPTKRVDEIVEAAQIPAYAAVEIRSSAGAGLALAAVRKMADETLRGLLTWSDAGVEHGTTIFRVAIGQHRESSPEDADERSEVVLFYALAEKAFLVSLDERVLRGLVADLAEGRGPVATNGKPRADGAQLVVDLAGQRSGGLFTVFGWLLSEQLVRASAPARADAEALLRGAPELASDRAALRALALAYFGAVSTPPHGGSYTIAADGVRDPLLGSLSSPTWPKVPISGGAVDKLLGAIGRFRSEIAFDPEGSDASARMRSLHVRASFGLRDPAD
jgi:hypothetical protein